MGFLRYLCNPLIKNFQPLKKALDSSLDYSRKDCKTVRITIPIDLILKIEEVRKEWGFKSRGSVIVKLLEVLLEEKDHEGGPGPRLQKSME